MLLVSVSEKRFSKHQVQYRDSPWQHQVSRRDPATLLELAFTVVTWLSAEDGCSCDGKTVDVGKITVSE